MTDEDIRVLKVAFGKAPEAAVTPNTLEAMQQIVGGYIKVIPLKNVYLVCDEEGKLMGLSGSRRLGDDIIAGIFFLAGNTPNGHFCPPTQGQVGHQGQHSAQPEVFQPDEVERKIYIEFYTMQAVILQPVGVDTDISSADAGAGYNHKWNERVSYCSAMGGYVARRHPP